jgi:hypothetical protein
MPSARLCALALLGALAVPALAAAQRPGTFASQPAPCLWVELSPATGAIIPCPPPALQEPAAGPAEVSGHPLLALKLTNGAVDGTRSFWEAFFRPGRGLEFGSASVGWFRELPNPEDVSLGEFVAQISENDAVETNGFPPAVPTAGLELPPSPPSLRPARVPVPALYRLGVTARQTLTGSLLLGIHPLLVLMPTADFLDAPGDHPQPVAGADLLESSPPSDQTLFGIWGSANNQVSFDHPTWYDWLVGHFIKRHVPTTPEPEVQLAQFLVEDGADQSKEPAIEQLRVMPKEEKAAEPDFTCPYLRQQAADRHVRLMADPEVTQDVLGNLERLVEADRLFEVAGELMRAGYVPEGMACYDAVRRLVPGSRFEAQVAEALAEFGIGAPAEAAEEPKAEPQGKLEPASWLDVLARLADAIGLPVPRFINVYSSDPNVRIRELLNDSEDLRQIESEWRRIWSADRPAHLPPERVNGPIDGAEPGLSVHLQAATKNRKAPLSEREKDIEKRLQTPVTVNFTDAPLRTVVEDLRTFQGINIYVDETALAEQGISLDRPVTVKLEQVSLKSVLNLLLRPLRLTYVIKDEVLQITTEDQARGNLLTTTYDVADLVKKKARTTCAAEPSEEETLMRLIANTIDPRTWSSAGGRGTVEYYPRTHSLVIKQTTDVQEQVADLLAALRRHLEDQKAGVAEQVAGLMKACRLAAEAGDNARAADLARQAEALDPEAVTADPLVYKLHLLTPGTKNPGECPAASCPRRQDPSEAAPPAVTEEAEPPLTLRPALPAVDPGVVSALDGLLDECRVFPSKPEEKYPLCDDVSEGSEAPAPNWGELLGTLLGSHGRAELGIDLPDGGVRVSCAIRCAGKVYHLVYREGAISLWTAPDASVAPEGEDVK